MKLRVISKSVRKEKDIANTCSR